MNTKKRTCKKLVAMILSLMMVLTLASQAGFAQSSSVEPAAGTIASDFLSPDGDAKPSARYWVPQAAIEKDTLLADFQDLVALGFDSVEVCSSAISSSVLGYEWGTEHWNQAMTDLMAAAEEAGITVEMNNGHFYPIRMPSVENADDEGSSYEMTYATANLAAGETYDAVIPTRQTVRPAGTSKLFAAYAYRVAEGTTLELDSYIDLMPFIELDEAVNQNSTLAWTAPEDGDYVLFFFFEQPVCQGIGSFGTTAEGPFVVDHYGKAGVQAIIDYWTEVFEKDPTQLNVENIFSDSIEILRDKDWTRGFQDIFEEVEGYDITPYLPVLGETAYYNSSLGPNYSFTDSEFTSQIRADYNDAITYCLQKNHLEPLQEFCESVGMNARYQVAYNLRADIVSSALYVALPEVEGTNLDQLRLMASAVHMTEGSNLYSMEIGFESGNNYGQTYEDLMWKMKRAWAAGINKPYLHGASYAGNFQEDGTLPDISWPGYHGWNFVSNAWDRYTSMENAADEMAYMARNNYVMQKDAKMDVVIFREQYVDAQRDGTSGYTDGGVLNSYGYSYEYLDTQILALDTAQVTNGKLNEAGPGYKAIILNNQSAISYEAATLIQSMVEAGLPLVIVGEAPSALQYYSDVVAGHTNDDIAGIFNGLLADSGIVKQVEGYADVPVALKELGVTPNASYETPVDILAMHTTDGVGDYYYLYNYNQTGSYPDIDKEADFSEKDAVVTLQGEGRPYYMNAWNGEITPIAEYTLNEGSVTVPLHFDEDEAKLIVLLNDDEALKNGIEPLDNSVISKNTTDKVEFVNGELTLKATENGTSDLTLSNGQEVSVTAENVQPEVGIDQWTLRINSIHQGDTVYFRDSAWTELDAVEITELKPWAEINPDWADISGIGTYTATLNLDKGWQEGYGAYLNIGEVSDTYTVTVNGTELPTVDQIAGIIDIGPYVQAGENTIVIEVATTLWNAVNGNVNPYDSYGLLGTDGKVTVTPYEAVGVEPDAVLSATAPETAQVNEDFVVSVVADSSITDVKLFNENDMALGRKDVQITDNQDGTKTFDITISVGTVGNDRTFKVVTKGAESYYKDSGVTVSVDITSVPASMVSFDLPESAVANRTFIITATTDLSATKIEVYNETGMKMGIKSLSSKVVDGQKVWTGVMSIGTQGDRTFSACAVNKYGARSEALTDTISVKAFAL